MALPASGAISLSAVNTELGLSATAAIGMNDSAVRTLFGVASGAIALSDGYGKSNGGIFIAKGGSTSPYPFYSFGATPTLASVTQLGSVSSPGWYNPGCTISNGSDVFVMWNSGTSDSYGRFIYSTDAGANWTTVQNPAGNAGSWTMGASGYGGLMVVAGGSTKFAYASESSPGSWTFVNTLPGSQNYSSMVVIPSVGFFLISQTRLLLKSTNGSTWSTVTNNLSDIVPTSLEYGNGTLMAVGQSSVNNRTATSTDNGATWTVNSSTGISTATFAFKKVTYITGSTWISTYNSGGLGVIARTTNNGSSWSTITLPGSGGPVTYGPPLTNGAGVVMIGGAGNYYWYSTDAGANWTQETTTASTSKLPVFTRGFRTRMEW